MGEPVLISVSIDPRYLNIKDSRNASQFHLVQSAKIYTQKFDAALPTHHRILTLQE